MGIITISRGCYSHGKEIAEKVANKLNYECVSNEILLEASEYFNVPEIKLLSSLHDPPSVFERLTHGRDTFMAYIRAALLEHVKRDNVVYHGYAGHLLLAGVPGVLKVRVLAQMDERINMISRLKNVSTREATRHIQEEDDRRARWTQAMYKEDIAAPWHYDLIVQIGALTITDACSIISLASQAATYQTSEADRQRMNDLALSSHVKAILQPYGHVDVTSDGGNIKIMLPIQKIRKSDFSTPQASAHLRERVHDELIQEIVGLVQKIPDVKDVVCDLDMPRYS